MEHNDTQPIHVRFDDETMRTLREINRKQAREAWIVIATMIVFAVAMGWLAVWLIGF